MALLRLLLWATVAAGSYIQSPTPRTPIMGWSSWCTDTGIIPCYDDRCSAKEILAVATYMKNEGLLALGYDHLLLDDCWAAHNRTAANGFNLTADLTRFPNGMRDFTQRVHALGFKLGLYTDVGEKTCRGGRLGAWPYYEQDAITFALDWGTY